MDTKLHIKFMRVKFREFITIADIDKFLFKFVSSVNMILLAFLRPIV